MEVSGEMTGRRWSDRDGVASNKALFAQSTTSQISHLPRFTSVKPQDGGGVSNTHHKKT